MQVADYAQRGKAYASGNLLMNPSFQLLLFLSLVGISFFGCRAEGEDVLTVAAASDMEFCLRELKGRFEAKYGTPVQVVTGSSGVLSFQIEEGAPFDLFLSADESVVDRVIEKGKGRAETRRRYALGILAIVTHRGSGRDIGSLKALAQVPGIRIVVPNPSVAPYGRAAMGCIMKEGLEGRLKGSIIYAESAMAALQTVSAGNVDAGVVPLSLAIGSGLEYAIIEPKSYEPLVQTLVVVEGSRNAADAERFAEFVLSPEGKEILSKYGFLDVNAR